MERRPPKRSRPGLLHQAGRDVLLGCPPYRGSVKRFRWTWFLWHRTPGPAGYQIPGATPPTVPFKTPPTFGTPSKPSEENDETSR
ncbi:MAG: hypothetical protein JWL79_3856 [Frankiales bacterium]|nr:hypothetical protein [Frankiales bacterium]